MLAKPAAAVAAALITGSPGPLQSQSVAAEESGYVAVFLVTRKPGMSFEEFKAYQLKTHVPLALALPGLETYRLSFFPDAGTGAKAADAMAEVRFANVAAYEKAMASEAGERALADLPNMLDMDALAVLVAGERYEAGLLEGE